MKTRSEKNLKKINKLIKLCKKEAKDSDCIFTIRCEEFYMLENIRIYISSDADVLTGGGSVNITITDKSKKSEYVMNFYLHNMDHEISNIFREVYKHLEMRIKVKNLSKPLNLKVKIGNIK